jgi:hypothetical protein
MQVNSIKTAGKPSGLARKSPWRAGLLAACLVAALGASSAGAEESTLSKDAKQAGHAIGEAARDVGHAAKQAGVEIGHGAAHAAKEAGPATKEAGHEVGSAFSEFGHKIGHAAKQGWEAFLGLFRSKN